MNTYTATVPSGTDWDLRDLSWFTQQNLDPRASCAYNTITHQIVAVVPVSIAANTVTAWQTAAATFTPDPNTPWRLLSTLVQRAQNALANNDAYLGLPHPVTNAQALAQIDAITKQSNGVIRMLLGQLDTITDTI